MRQSEDELSEVKERFRVLAESSLTGIYLTEQDRFTYVNPALAKMFGYEVEEVVGRLGSTDLTCPDDRSLVAENMRRRLQGDVEEMRYEFRGLRKDGSVFPVEVHGRRIEHGGRIGVLGTLIDNTERKRAEDELRESEARFRKLTDLSSDWYWRQDENLRFTHAADEKAGYSMPVSLGKTRWELPVTPLSASWDEHRAVLAARQPFRDFQYSRIDPEGGTHYISVSGVPVFDERGAFKGYDGVASDITPRKRAEQALRESEARFRTFVDRATDAFFLLDEQLVVVDVNRQACASLGWSREELIGMHPRDFDVGLDEPSIRAARAARRRRGDHYLRDAPSAQGRHGVPGRDPQRHVQAGRRALLPGARARHQRAQARGGISTAERSVPGRSATAEPYGELGIGRGKQPVCLYFRGKRPHFRIRSARGNTDQGSRLQTNPPRRPEQLEADLWRNRFAKR